MLRVSAAARNYAKSLFLLAKKHNVIDKTAATLELFKKSFSEDFAHELQNPVISKADLVKIMEEILAKFSFEKIVADFLLTVAANKRLNLFLEISQEFESLLKKHKNVLKAEVVFATKSDNDQLSKIKAIIEKKYLGKTVEIKETVNPKILGGFQIRIGSDVIDASLKNQIFNLKQELV
ncbi:MAG: ATP synthase F1 subunit delta [Rickettsiales bacterium]|nr:ATP synthase F1 subunit delta [Rickettsiales bacterium]